MAPEAPYFAGNGARATRDVGRILSWCAVWIGAAVCITIVAGWPLGLWAATLASLGWYPVSLWTAALGGLLLVAAVGSLTFRPRLTRLSAGLALLGSVTFTVMYLWRLGHPPGAPAGADSGNPWLNNPIVDVIAGLVALAALVAVGRRRVRTYTALVSASLIASLSLLPATFSGQSNALTPVPGTSVNPVAPLLMLCAGVALAAAYPDLPPITWVLRRNSGLLVGLVVANLLAIPFVLRIVDRLAPHSTRNSAVVYTVVALCVLVEAFLVAQLLADRDRWSRISELATDGVLVTDEQERILEANDSMATLLQVTPEDLVGTTFALWLPLSDRATHAAEALRWRENPEVGGQPLGDLTMVRRDGSLVPVEAVKRPVWHRGRLYAVLSIRDATAAAQLRSENEEIRALLADATDTSPLGQMLVGREGQILRATASMCELLGFPGSADLIGRRVVDFVAPPYRDSAGEAFAQVADGVLTAAESDVALVRADGTRVWGHVIAKQLHTRSGQTVTSLQVADITGRVRAEQRAESAIADLEYRSSHDPLTGLPNRSQLVGLLNSALAGGAHCAVLYCDLDNFKLINDEFSHQIGDDVLLQLSRRMSSSVGSSGTVARISGDEFAVLLLPSDGQDIPTAAIAVAEALQLAVARQPFDAGIATVYASLSIGLAVSNPGRATRPQPAPTAESLLRDADVALHVAKREGRGGYRVFDEGIRNDAERRRRMARDLAQALHDGRIAAWAQPVVRMSDRQVIGYEALARWQVDAHDPWTAGKWIGIADEAGLLAPVSDVVLAQTISAMRRFPDDVWLAVNVAGSQLTPAAAEQWLELLRGAGADPARLVLEVLEQSLTHAPTSARAAIDMLVSAGARIFYDDFGSGHTSVASLSTLPISGIKLDRHFTARIGTSVAADRVARALAGLAYDLQLTTIAEGVESPEQARLLTAAGWDLGQGELFGLPRDLDTLGNRIST